MESCDRFSAWFMTGGNFCRLYITGMFDGCPEGYAYDEGMFDGTCDEFYLMPINFEADGGCYVATYMQRKISLPPFCYI